VKKLLGGLLVALTIPLGVYLWAQSCTSTPNLGLCKGARGAAEWDVFLNSNFDIIDASTLNTTSGAQTKTGTLTLSGAEPLKFTGTGYAAGDIPFLGTNLVLSRSNSLHWDSINGRLGIGTAAPTTTLDVSGTVKATGLNIPTGAAYGKVLTSDVSGNATWQTGVAAQVGWERGVLSNVMLANISDTVGIGTTYTEEKLEVVGGIKIGNSLTSQAGVIRWNGSHFQGYTGSAWVDLDYNSTASGGWTDAGTTITLTSSTDRLGIGLGAGAEFKVGISDTNASALYIYQSLASGYSAPAIDLVSVWTAGTAAPTAFKISVTDVSSAATSKLINALVGGNSKFSVDKTGAIFAAAGLSATTGTFSGALEAATIKLTTGATAGFVLTSDASGNGTWQASGAGAGIPSGMIAIFDTSCPSGWTSVSGAGSPFFERFPVGAATYGSTGGLEAHQHLVDPASFTIDSGGTHTHTVTMGTFQTDSSTGTYYAQENGSGLVVSPQHHSHTTTISDRLISASGAHTHAVNVPGFYDQQASSIPPFIAVVYCKKN